MKSSIARVFQATGLAACCLLPIGCDRNSTARMPAPDLYRLHCSGCHGSGTGDGHIAGSLGVQPRDFTNATWQDSVSDSHIRQTIEKGGAAVRKSEKMPAFSDKLNRAEIDALVDYLRSLGTSL